MVDFLRVREYNESSQIIQSVFDFAYVNNVRLFTQFSHVGRLYSLATSK